MAVADKPGMRTSVAFGPFRLHFSRRLLEKEGVPVALGSRAMDVLIALVERAGDVVTKQELTRRVWPNITVDESRLRVHVATLPAAHQVCPYSKATRGNIAVAINLL